MDGLLAPSAPLCDWVEEGSTMHVLVEKITNLYWESIIREVGHAIMCMIQLRDTQSLPEEDDIISRLPANAADFISLWAPSTVSENDMESIWDCAATLMAERQRPSLAYRRARMLLEGLGMLDIDRLIEFREPPLRSQAGRVQVNLAEIPSANGKPKILVQAVNCCECRRLIRSSFYNCEQICVHHDRTLEGGCGLAKHQYKVCASCYPNCDHAKQHLKKVRPYDPMAASFVQSFSQKDRKKLSEDIHRLQIHEDKQEDIKDGNRNLRTISNNLPEAMRKRILPFGNVHASVTFGPLIFEIGAQHAKRGALITLRKSPDLSYSDTWRFVGSERTTPGIAISPERKIFTCVRDTSSRISHASMKQVAGGLFSGHLRHWTASENAVINAFVEESTQFEERPTKSREYNSKLLRTAARRVVEILKTFLSEEVDAYIRHFAHSLMNHELNLTWDQVTNNCQTFCKGLLAGNAFLTIIPKNNPALMTPGKNPRYLLSFASEHFGSMFDTKRYTTTPLSQYLSEFHIDEDEIEYFETWPDIPLVNPCSKLLCWPCLNDETCSIPKHMWLMPHETISLIQLHIIRDRLRYRGRYMTQDPLEGEPALLTDQQWFSNRLSVLLGLDTFLGSAGALAASFQVFSEPMEEGGHAGRRWEAKLTNDVGAFIQQGTRERESNFTIEKPRKSLLPDWSSKSRRMEKHLEKTTTKKWSNFDS